MIPTFRGRRGHPALIDWKHVQSIQALPANEGINSFLRQCAHEVAELPVNSEEVLLDLDTRADYERIQQEWMQHRQ